MIDEPTVEDAISILRGLKDRYETHHHVRIKDEAIIAAVELSNRYITDRFLPDKAIDLIDESAAKLRLEMNSMPEELDKLERQIRQLEIEREAIKRENDQEKLRELAIEISNIAVERDTLKAKWKQEKELVEKVQDAKQKIEQLKSEAEQAERNGDYGSVAEIRYGKVKEQERIIDQYSLQLTESTEKRLVERRSRRRRYCRECSKSNRYSIGQNATIRKRKIITPGRRVASSCCRAGRSHYSRCRCHQTKQSRFAGP